MDGQDVLIVLAGNKADRIGGGSNEIEKKNKNNTNNTNNNKNNTQGNGINRELIEEWCRENGDIPYFEISAKENTNVGAMFEAITEDVLNMRRREKGQEASSLSEKVFVYLYISDQSSIFLLILIPLLALLRNYIYIYIDEFSFNVWIFSERKIQKQLSHST